MANKEVIKINESQLQEIVRKSVKSVLEQYQLGDIEEITEYLWLRPSRTGLNVDVFVDDGGSYIRHRHSLLLFVRNGYDKSVSEFIPFSISEKPMILDDSIDYNISYNDIFAVQDFIVANKLFLIQMANEEISHTSFLQSIRIPSYVVVESKTTIMEMATLRMSDSNLPMDVWLDEGATYQEHAPRLKFRASNEQRTTREFSSMLLTNPPTIENLPSNSPLKKKDIDKLKQFVIDNLEKLLQLAKGEIDYTTDFLPNIIKG